MAFIYNLLDTWNNAGTVFSAIKLNVTNTASAAGSKLIDLQIGGSTFFNVDKSGQVALLAGTAAAPTLIPTGDTNTGMWFPAADTIAWSTGGSERLRITSSGNVGIGTSSPVTLLHLSVTAAPTGTTQTFSRLTAGNTFGADFGGGLIQGVGSIATISTVNNGIATERIRIIDPSGNVGIGTSSPRSPLDVNGVISARSDSNALAFEMLGRASDNISILRFLNNNGTAELGKIGHYGTNILLSNSAVNGSQIFYTTDIERMRITSSGSVGIGTSSPTTLLSVNGVASFGAGTAALPSIAAFGDLDTGIWFPAANTLALSTGGVERLRITSAGNLGLGSSTFGTSAATVFSIANGTAPTTGPADTIQIYSTDLSAGNTMLSLYTEGTVVNANTTAAATHRIAIRVNGTVYYLLANTSSA